MTEALDTSSPGSYDQFAERHDLDPKRRETLDRFTGEAGEHRTALARGLGLTLEELHISPNPGTEVESDRPTQIEA
jgi:hypothetical protein